MNERLKIFRCAVYTRKSTEHNLDLEFNSLHAQRESCEAFIKSQMHEGWQLIPDRYDPAVDITSPEEILNVLDNAERTITRCVNVMPDHSEYIAHTCRAPAI